VPELPQSPETPFALGDGSRGDAAAFMRLLFSPTIGGSRVRIASESAWIGQFGLTMSAPDRGYLSASGLAKPPAHAERAIGLLAPGGLRRSRLPDYLPAITPSQAIATVAVDDHGMIITVAQVRWNVPAGEVATALMQHSAIRESSSRDHPLATLGLAITEHPQRVAIRPNTSESTIKLTALIARGGVLVLTPGRQPDGSAMRVVVCLAMPVDTAVSLPALSTVAAPDVEHWMRIAWDDEPTLPRDLRLLLAEHLPLHDSWLDSAVVEHLLGRPPAGAAPVCSPLRSLT